MSSTFEYEIFETRISHTADPADYMPVMMMFTLPILAGGGTDPKTN